MKVDLYFLNSQLAKTLEVRESCIDLCFRPTVEDAKKLVALEVYERVASIECPSTSIFEAANCAYAASQHIDSNWTEGASVSEVFLPNKCRSSSVGDVFVIDGNAMLIAPVGFEPMPEVTFVM